MRKIVCLISFMIFGYLAKAQEIRSTNPSDIWASEMMQKMTLDEKIGQIFMLRAHSNLGKEHEKKLTQEIEKYHPGGLCFFQGDAKTQATLTNSYQSKSKIPLLIAMDAEWGLGMRFPKTSISFPRQLTLGAITDNDLVYEMGKNVAKHLKRIGVNLNFAPVVDINNNPSNPVINNRSFGEDMFNVSSKSYAYMKGLQENGVLACAKHFPGHGDTNVDSHLDLPVLTFDRNRLDSLELKPFRVLSELNVGSIMTAHLHVPSIDNRPNRPISLSANGIQQILRKDIGFKGLVITDALEMQGVAKNFKKGEMAVEAFIAGNDILLMPIDFKIAFEAIKEAIENGKITEERLNTSVLNILKHKFQYNIHKNQKVINISSVMDDINDKNGIALNETLYENALTLVHNQSQNIPVKQLLDKKYASISLGSNTITAFQSRLKSYTEVASFNLPKDFSNDAKRKMVDKLEAYEMVFVSLHDMSKYESKGFGITQQQKLLIYELSTRTNVVLTLFGSPYALRYFSTIPTIMVAYEENEIVQDKAAQAYFGAFSIKGKLPVTAHEQFPYGSQIITPNLQRLRYGIPESVGMNSDTLSKIDGVIQEMLDKKAAPGCQILIAKDGKIVFQKAYGYHDYDKKVKVSNEHLYDVASVTKILASTISLMALHDKGLFNRKAPLSSYLPELKSSNKGNLIGDEVLSHHSRLAGWIPFYKKTLTDDKKPNISDKYYRSTSNDSFNIKVCDDLYLRFDYRDSIFQRIADSELRDKREYKYSDLGFYLFQKIIEKTSEFTLDKYARWKFYKPLNLSRTLFNPLTKFSIDEIVPSEKDEYFRDTKVQGYVHDMGAAMLGGVAGHAGLFSTSQDLAVLMQMLINGGSYGGYQYLKPETIQIFTRRYGSSTRRGLGFDMKEMNSKKTLNMAEEASNQTFGHLGFTGAAVFADPEEDLIYIFLSNRTFPTMENKTFGRKNYRPRVQSIAYRAIKAYNTTNSKSTISNKP